MIWRIAHPALPRGHIVLKKAILRIQQNLTFVQILRKHRSVCSQCADDVKCSNRPRIQVKRLEKISLNHGLTSLLNAPATWHAENWARIIRMPPYRKVVRHISFGESNETGAVVTSQLLAVTFADHCLRVERHRSLSRRTSVCGCDLEDKSGPVKIK